jgi:cytochrome c oxidase subunit II
MNFWRHLGALPISSALLLSGCGGRQPQQTMLRPAGPMASRIEGLWWFIFWISLIVFVLVMAALTRAASARRVRGQAPPELHPDAAGEQRRFRRVLVCAGLTIVLLFVILVYSISTLGYMNALESKNPLTIEVVGHQWWWEIHYPNSDASMYVTTANEIHVPTKTPVVLLTSARDVIHSFWAPNLQGKRDLIPGYQTAIWFQADQEGIYRGQCAEFCGAQHAHMAFYIVAEGSDKFRAWLEQQRKPANNPSDAVAQHGEEVFLKGECVMCHTIRGTGAGARLGPDLTHLASRSTIAAGTLPNNAGSLAGWIANSQSVKPGNRMPPISLPSQDLQALIKYLQTLN